MAQEREIVSGRYHRLTILDCPIGVLEALAREIGFDVTVENVRPVRASNEWFESRQALAPGTREGRFRIRNAMFDTAMTNAEFLEHLPFWDQNGVFAVFSERSPIAFRASDLPEPARHRALDNFGGWLCFALAGPTTDGTSVVVSPRAELLDLAQSLLESGV